jgi:hypothetical protein
MLSLKILYESIIVLNLSSFPFTLHKNNKVYENSLESMQINMNIKVRSVDLY